MNAFHLLLCAFLYFSIFSTINYFYNQKGILKEETDKRKHAGVEFTGEKYLGREVP